MTITLVAATALELKPFLAALQADAAWQQLEPWRYRRGDLELHVLITGPGLMHTAFALGNYLSNHKPDCLLQAGIAGAYDRSLALGQAVVVASETLADLAVEEADGQLRDLFSLGLLEAEAWPFAQGRLWAKGLADLGFLPQAHSLSVQTVRGYAPSIEAMQQRYPYAQIENMEGAAFFYAAIQAKCPFIALRSISNYVESRNREAWRLDLALPELSRVLQAVLGAWV